MEFHCFVFSTLFHTISGFKLTALIIRIGNLTLTLRVIRAGFAELARLATSAVGRSGTVMFEMII